MIRLPASISRLNREPQNIEFRSAESLSETQALQPARAGGFAESFF